MVYILTGAALIAIFSLISIFQNKRKPHPKSKRIEKVLALLSTLLFIPYMVIAVVAYIHGADLESLQRFGVLRTIQAIQNTPVTDRSVDIDQPGNILIYYRFGCRDCEAVYDSLKTEVAGKENIYWVASRQSEGQKLLQKYAVSEVPAGVIIQNDGMYISYVLCSPVYDDADKKGGMQQLDIYALNRLLDLQKIVKK
ncbi:MAG: hypothetical protein K2G55_17325 [Lachnospiraceae bacterium]|nr:hypothetical protein [Lachnospiraceae bacterium]